MLSIMNATDALATSITDYFDAHDYTWKSSEALTAFEPSKPTVYKFCVPPSDLNETQMPTHCPCVLLALTKWQKLNDRLVQLEYAINCVVVDPCECDREKAYEQPDGSFVMGENDTYSQNAANLYRACLLLAEGIVDAVSTIAHTTENGMSIEVNEFEPPHALLPDYPFATCVVPVTVKIINNGAHSDAFNRLL